MKYSERNTAPRIALLFVVIGLIIFIVSLGVLAYSERDVRRASVGTGGEEALQSPAIVGATWMRATFWLAILMFVFVIALSAFLRWSRRYRQNLFRSEREPTEYADAWSMHRLPDEDDDDAEPGVARDEP